MDLRESEKGARGVCLGLGSVKTRVFSTNTQSRFVSVIRGSVLLFLAFVVPETTHEVSLALQGFETETKILHLRRCHVFLAIWYYLLACTLLEWDYSKM